MERRLLILKAVACCAGIRLQVGQIDLPCQVDAQRGLMNTTPRTYIDRGIQHAAASFATTLRWQRCCSLPARRSCNCLKALYVSNLLPMFMGPALRRRSSHICRGPWQVPGRGASGREGFGGGSGSSRCVTRRSNPLASTMGDIRTCIGWPGGLTRAR